MANKERVVKVDEEVDELLAEMARVTGSTKSEILRELVRALGEEAKRSINTSKQEGEMDVSAILRNIPAEYKESVLGRVAEALATSRLMDKLFEDNKKVESIDMDTLMKMMFIKTLTQPDLNQLLLYERLMSSSKKDDDTAKLFTQLMAQQMQTQQQIQQQMMTMLFGVKQEEQKRSYEELKQQTNKMIEELNKRIEMLQDYMLSAKSSEEKQTLAKQIKEIVEFKESLKQAADVLGLVEQKEVVDDRGKINWARVLDKGLKMGEKLIDKIDKLKAPAPAPRTVVEMPVPQSPPEQKTPQEVVKEAKPEVREESPEEERKFIVPTEEEVKVEEKVEETVVEKEAEETAEEVAEEATKEVEEEAAVEEAAEKASDETQINEEEQIKDEEHGGAGDEEVVAESSGEQEVSEGNDSQGSSKDKV